MRMVILVRPAFIILRVTGWCIQAITLLTYGWARAGCPVKEVSRERHSYGFNLGGRKLRRPASFLGGAVTEDSPRATEILINEGVPLVIACVSD